MKSLKKVTAFALAVLMLMSVSACKKADKLYGVKTSPDESAPVKKIPNYDYPQIVSFDRVMSDFVDISLYDEEDYSKLYLGKKFKFNAKYNGQEINPVLTLKEMRELGWDFTADSEYNDSSLLRSGAIVNVALCNPQGYLLEATFFNGEKTNKPLKDCDLVKFKVSGNNFYNPEIPFADFNINGISNNMAVTDVINTLGAPSHFYAVDQNNYYLDYFMSEKDRRNGITVYVNIADDCITAIEWSNFK